MREIALRDTIAGSCLRPWSLIPASTTSAEENRSFQQTKWFKYFLARKQRLMQPGPYWCFSCICLLLWAFFAYTAFCFWYFCGPFGCPEQILITIIGGNDYEVSAKQKNSVWNEAAVRNHWDLWPSGQFGGGSCLHATSQNWFLSTTLVAKSSSLLHCSLGESVAES